MPFFVPLARLVEDFLPTLEDDLLTLWECELLLLPMAKAPVAVNRALRTSNKRVRITSQAYQIVLKGKMDRPGRGSGGYRHGSQRSLMGAHQINSRCAVTQAQSVSWSDKLRASLIRCGPSAPIFVPFCLVGLCFQRMPCRRSFSIRLRSKESRMTLMKMPTWLVMMRGNRFRFT